MKYIKVSDGNVVLATVMPKSSWIDKAADRTFVGEGYIEVNENILDNDLLLHKYDSSAEEESVKTVASFTSPGVDAQGNQRWFTEDTGVLMQYTYNADNQIIGEEEV